MSNCKTCANAIFNEQWGEYKCKVFQKTIYDPSRILGCEAYKKKPEKKESEAKK